VILAHTTFQELLLELHESAVLVAGRHSALQVARAYGFKRAVSTQQLAAAYGAPAVPFSPVSRVHDEEPYSVRDLGVGTAALPICAVLVMTDPDDWFRDLQLISDTVISRGRPGEHFDVCGGSDVQVGRGAGEKRSRAVCGRVAFQFTTPPPQSQTPRPPQVVFSQQDLLWANDHHSSRYGLGAFATALCAVYQAATGEPLRIDFHGKPTARPYRMAERLLQRQLDESPHMHENAGGYSGALRADVVALLHVVLP